MAHRPIDDPRADQVLEIGIVVFEYAAETGQVGPVVGCLSALEDPGRPIPPESTAIHGITDDMVKGQRFALGISAIYGSMHQPLSH